MVFKLKINNNSGCIYEMQGCRLGCYLDGCITVHAHELWEDTLQTHLPVHYKCCGVARLIIPELWISQSSWSPRCLQQAHKNICIT